MREEAHAAAAVFDRHRDAEEPQRANDLYLYCCDQVKARGLEVKQGVFRAHMAVSLINDGPVTILLDSKKQF